MAEVLGGGDQFGDGGAGFGDVAREHVAKCVWAEIRKVRSRIRIVDDLADGFGAFPRAAIEAGYLKSDVCIAG
jgi:hypothetical protein